MDVPTSAPDVKRRDFLRWLAASPLLAGVAGCDLDEAIAQEAPRRTLDALVASAQEALDVFDLQRVAEATLPHAHYGYMDLIERQLRAWGYVP